MSIINRKKGGAGEDGLAASLGVRLCQKALPPKMHRSPITLREAERSLSSRPVSTWGFPARSLAPRGDRRPPSKRCASCCIPS